MENSIPTYTSRAATVGGVLTVLIFKVNIDELLMNALLAAVGALVSFGVSTFLSYLLKRWRRK